MQTYSFVPCEIEQSFRNLNPSIYARHEANHGWAQYSFLFKQVVMPTDTLPVQDIVKSGLVFVTHATAVAAATGNLIIDQ